MKKDEVCRLRLLGVALTERNAHISEWLKYNLIRREELSRIRMTVANEKLFTKVRYPDGIIKEWVGIGWIDAGTTDGLNNEELKNIPVVF